MKNIFLFLTTHYKYLLIVVGLLKIVGAILKWNWMLDPSGKMRNSLLFSPIINKWGEKGLIGINVVLGIILVIVGIISLLFY